MQSASDIAQKEETLVSAEALREMTVSKETLFERQKESVLDTLMGTMVRIASEQGGNEYSANLNPKFDPSLLTSITTRLQELGYTVTVETKTAEAVGQYPVINIKW